MIAVITTRHPESTALAMLLAPTCERVLPLHESGTSRLDAEPGPPKPLRERLDLARHRAIIAGEAAGLECRRLQLG